MLTGRIIGASLLILWLFCVAGARKAMQAQGYLSHATIFQYGILPLVVGSGLVVTGNLLLLLIVPVAWILSIVFPTFFLCIFPLICAWELSSNIAGWKGGLVGLCLMFTVCSIVTGLITAPKRLSEKEHAAVRETESVFDYLSNVNSKSPLATIISTVR